MNLVKMRFLALLGAVLLGITAFSFPGCSTDFVVYAPEKEIRSVYCVLDPEDSVQYVRIAKAYQVEGDAYVYAAANDLSVKNLNVRLTGNGITYTAIQVDSFPIENGIFYPYITIYKFVTDSAGPGRLPIQEGQTYTLEVGSPGDADYLTGVTTVPNRPRISGELSLLSGAGATKCLPRLALERDFNVVWDKGNASSWEMRIWFKYASAGVEQEPILWGPTKPLDGNRGCNGGSTQLCMKFEERSLLDFWGGKMQGPGPFTYDTQDSCITPPGTLPDPIVFEVTAIDDNLTKYMGATDPAVIDLTGAKPEWTNLTGNIQVVGIFGSINKDRKSAILRECGEYLLRLNNTLRPPSCVE